MARRVVRPAGPRDYAAILALARGVAEAGEAFPWEGSVSKEELALYWLPDRAHSVETFVCEVDGFDGIAGAYVLHPAAGGRGAHVAHAGYVVAPGARGKGLAKMMCAHSLQEAKQRGYLGMRLNLVVATNVAAVRAFTSCGFKIMCTLPRVFRHPQRGLVDAHVMFHTLDDLEVAPAPRVAAATAAGLGAGLSYPTAAAGANFAVGDQVYIEPRLGGRAGGGRAAFSVRPVLPEGLQINVASGVISGSPVARCSETTFCVTAKLEADITIRVDEQADSSGMVLAINEDFATRLANVTNVADLMPEPIKTRSYGDWMIWMVHRVWLNDPALVELNFNNMHMPPPHVESRIAPKLMAGLLSNTHIEVLTLSNANVQKLQGVELAAALRKNVTLRTVNLESNQLDSSSVRELALAIKANPGSRIEHLRFSHQKQMGQFFGRPTEEAVGQMMERNETIVRLGFECDDAHWRNIIDRALLRNNDYWRRRQQLPAEEELPPAEEKTLGQLLLSVPPASPTSELFAKGGALHAVFCGYVVQNGKLPTTSQLQSCAKNSGAALPYTTAAPLIRECRSALLAAAAGQGVVVSDAFGMETSGTLRAWSEINDNWNIEIWAEDGKRCSFRSSTEPAFSVSKAWREWLQATKPPRDSKVGGS